MTSIPVDTALQARAAEVLGRSGIMVELAIRMLFAHVAVHGSLPAGLEMPNADTRGHGGRLRDHPRTARPWHSLNTVERDAFDAPVTRRLAAAHVVVMLDASGMEVFRGGNLLVEQGCEEALPDDDAGPQISELRYYCSIRLDGTPQPNVWLGAGATIMIVGLGWGGTTIIVSGRGLFDRTGDSSFHIKFEVPPHMTIWIVGQTANTA